MAERIIQRGFDIDNKQIINHDVTPDGFTGLQSPNRQLYIPTPQLGRFVREVAIDTRFDTPQDATKHLYNHVFTPWDAFEQEELWMLLLNAKNKVTHEAMLYRGTINSIYVRPAEVFREAVRLNAAMLILAHNHPSNDPTPSREDIRATEKIIQAGNVLEISVLDHVILGRKKWVSLANKGVNFG